MRKGLTLMFQAAFVVLFLTVIITVLVPRLAAPTIEAHGNKQAEIAAERLSDAINAMSSMDEGQVEHNITGPWDIKVYSKEGMKYVNVSHEGYSAEAKIIGNVRLGDLPDVGVAKISKKLGEDVKVEKV